jgi:hypothetical protein
MLLLTDTIVVRIASTIRHAKRSGGRAGAARVVAATLPVLRQIGLVGIAGAAGATGVAPESAGR